MAWGQEQRHWVSAPPWRPATQPRQTRAPKAAKAARGPWTSCACGWWAWDDRGIEKCKVCGVKWQCGQHKKEAPSASQGGLLSGLASLDTTQRSFLEAVLAQASKELGLELTAALGLVTSKEEQQSSAKTTKEEAQKAQQAYNKAQKQLDKAAEEKARAESMLEKATKAHEEAEETARKAKQEAAKKMQEWLDIKGEVQPKEEHPQPDPGGRQGARPEEEEARDFEDEEHRAMYEAMAAKEKEIREARVLLAQAATKAKKRRTATKEGKEAEEDMDLEGEEGDQTKAGIDFGRADELIQRAKAEAKKMAEGPLGTEKPPG